MPSVGVSQTTGAVSTKTAFGDVALEFHCSKNQVRPINISLKRAILSFFFYGIVCNKLTDCLVAQHTMIGLNTGANTDNAYASIDCALYCDKGIVRAYERGKHRPLDNGCLQQCGPTYNHTTLLSLRRRGRDMQVRFSLSLYAATVIA